MAQSATSGAQLASQAASSLAMPAIVTTSPQQNSSQNQSVNFYQQQLIKSAQQFLSPQQQAARHQQQIFASHQQDDSPPLDSALYNGIQPQAFQASTLYGQKPPQPPPIAFYGQTGQPVYQQFARQPAQQPTQPQQPMYHHSPVQMSQQTPNGHMQQSPMSLSVRPLPMQNSPIQLARQAHELDPQRAQLVMPYQTQLNHSLQANELLHAQGYLPNQGATANHQDQLMHQSQQHIDVIWTQLDKTTHPNSTRRKIHSNHADRASRSRFSDRDSISTLSRFDQLDDRRSFTMRSQCTNVNNAKRYAGQFGFFKVAGEAIRRLLGFTDSNAERRLLSDTDHKQNLHRNLNLSVTSQSNPAYKNTQPFNPDIHRTSYNSSNVNLIDSGENYYFKREVFKFQLSLLRFISLLFSIIILLSPVVMLLVPKMEFLFNNHDYSDSPDTRNGNTPGSHLSRDSGLMPLPVVGIKHSVGLVGNKQSQNQQPQWRITNCGSECDGPLIGFVIRFIMLCIAYWAIFARAQTSSLPRIDTHRCLLISMALLLTSAYWMFFIFRVFDKRYNDFELQYITIIQFAISMLDSLILLHYLAIVLLELRKREKIYCLKVVRSPDGASQYFSCGALSIQHCGQYVIGKYLKNFQHFGPYSEHLMELEDELASAFGGGGENTGDKSPRSRPSSPAQSSRVGTIENRSGRRSASRSSRHHSRGTSHHRSPSSSAERQARSRSQRKSQEEEEIQKKQTQTRSEMKVGSNENRDGLNALDSKNINTQSMDSTENGSKQHENDNNSGDQSSEATSRMKESSLETIRAANSSSDLFTQSRPAIPSSSTSQVRASSSKDKSRHHNSRDETESVRSVRSRHSTSRSHHRHRESDRHHNHHQSHRDRSSSRTNAGISGSNHAVNVDPLDEHEKKLRRRKLRLLMSVQETLDQIKRVEEGKFDSFSALPSKFFLI